MKSLWFALPALALLLPIIPASAQTNLIIEPAPVEQLNPSIRSIVVNPVPSDLNVNISLNRPGYNPFYRAGEPIQISLSTNQDAYVYLFSVEADGRINLILPNRLSGGEQFVRAGEVRTFPPIGSRYRLTISPPYGQAQVLAVASRQALNLNEIAYFRQGRSFAEVQTTGAGLSRMVSKAIAVDEVPADGWTTNAVFYRVKNP